MKISLNEKFWAIKQEDGTLKIGLHKDYIERLGTIWTLVTRPQRKLVLNTPFVNVESSKCLGPMRAPITGDIVEWNEAMLEDPIFTPDAHLLIVKPESL